MSDHEHDFDILDSALEHDEHEREVAFVRDIIRRKTTVVHRFIKKCPCGELYEGAWTACDCGHNEGG